MKKLEIKEMFEILGGVSAKEYCATLDKLVDDNWDKWTVEQKRAAAYAFNKHC